MSGSDSDYVVVGAFENDLELVSENSHPISNVREKRVNASGQVIRGKDIQWVTSSKFDNIEEFKRSDIYLDLQTHFTLQRARESEYADSETYICKFLRKVGYRPCPLKYKVEYLCDSKFVIVNVNDSQERHIHDADPDHANSAINFKWSSAQTEIIMQGVLNEATPTVILRNLNDAQLFSNGICPTRQQLNNKIQLCRSRLNKRLNRLPLRKSLFDSTPPNIYQTKPSE